MAERETDPDRLIDEFCKATDTDPEVARAFVEAESLDVVGMAKEKQALREYRERYPLRMALGGRASSWQTLDVREGGRG